MERVWLKSYPEGVPATIDVTQYTSLSALLEDSFGRYADRQAFTSMGVSITYRELDQQSRRFGAWLQAKGLAKGARVAIMMPNVLQYPVAIAGILRAGYVVVNVNPLYTPRELEYQLKDCGAEAIVILENFAKTLEAAAQNTALKHIVVATMGDLLGAKGLVVNFAVRHVKKLRAGVAYPRLHRLPAGTARRRGRRFQTGHGRARRHRFPPIYGRHDGRRERGSSAASQYFGQRFAIGRLARSGAPASSGDRADHDRRCLADVSHLCPDGLWAADHFQRRAGRADSESA